ncbi:hypothetical protein AB0C10_32790 [Microbispora amethystogenes]|uniref:hypothetical protein n=1 Tax=Microbispora amethystogenes TaxID=1427754 RepID=UPI0033DC091D
MSTTQTRAPRNGVDTPTLFATLNAVKGDPELAKFRFRATNTWISGTHNRSAIRGSPSGSPAMGPPTCRAGWSSSPGPFGDL